MFVYSNNGVYYQTITVYEEEYHSGTYVEKIDITYDYKNTERRFWLVLRRKNDSGYRIILSLRRLLGWLLITDNGMSCLESFKLIVHIMYIFHTIDDEKLLRACITNFGL